MSADLTAGRVKRQTFRLAEVEHHEHVANIAGEDDVAQLRI